MKKVRFAEPTTGGWRRQSQVQESAVRLNECGPIFEQHLLRGNLLSRQRNWHRKFNGIDIWTSFRDVAHLLEPERSSGHRPFVEVLARREADPCCWITKVRSFQGDAIHGPDKPEFQTRAGCWIEVLESKMLLHFSYLQSVPESGGNLVSNVAPDLAPGLL